jgi:transposase-like protein
MRPETNAISTKSRREELVKKFRQSGLPASEFAREHGINESTFSNWVRGQCGYNQERLRKQQAKIPEILRLYDEGKTVNAIVPLVNVGRHQVRKILQTHARIEAKPRNSKTIQLDEKIRILRAMCEEGLSIPMAVSRFGVEHKKLWSWVKTAIDTHVPIRMRICGKVGE